MTTLRKAKPFDALAVAGILGEFVDTTPWMPRIHTPAEDFAHAKHIIDRGWVTVAERGKTVVGFAALNGSDLNAVYVTQSARGSGVGHALLNHLKAQSPRLQLWTFQANDGAQRFYERHGFTEIQRTQGAANDEQLPDIQYEWHKETAA